MMYIYVSEPEDGMYERPKSGEPLIAREAAAKYVPGAPTEEWITAAEFKTHCLRLIEQVRQGHGDVVVTRYGKPVARLVPFTEPPMSLFGHLAGSITWHGDLIAPIDEEWDADA
jgi:prevent-host-death family protein